MVHTIASYIGLTLSISIMLVACMSALAKAIGKLIADGIRIYLDIEARAFHVNYPSMLSRCLMAITLRAL